MRSATPPPQSARVLRSASAALTALALTAAFLTKMQGQVNIDAANPYVLVGLLIGCMLPFRFSAMAMVAVGKAAQDMIQEVRRQFRDIPELRPALEAARAAESDEREPTEAEAAIINAADGKAEYSHCVRIATDAAIRKMIAPGIMAVLVPVIVGLISVDMLGGLLIGVTISGVCLAIFQSNAGGAWDNSKKQVKDQGHAKWGDDFDEMHKATVTGDTVGRPLQRHLGAVAEHPDQADLGGSNDHRADSVRDSLRLDRDNSKPRRAFGLGVFFGMRLEGRHPHPRETHRLPRWTQMIFSV